MCATFSLNKLRRSTSQSCNHNQIKVSLSVLAKACRVQTPGFFLSCGMDIRPIGIFDSGLGGLSVWKEIAKQLPRESVLYYADSFHCPYGAKSQDEIIHLSEQIVEFLLSKEAKLIVVACNTATAGAIAHLRGKYEIPFVGMEPAVKPAANMSVSKKIGILATRGTFDGEHFKATTDKYAQEVEVHVEVGNGLVELVENGYADSHEAELLVRQYLEPMLAQGVDQIVLGCTHYPFLRSIMEKVVGDKANLVDPAPAVARQVRNRIKSLKIGNGTRKAPDYQFYTSGEIRFLQQLAQSVAPLAARPRMEFWKVYEE